MKVMIILFLFSMMFDNYLTQSSEQTSNCKEGYFLENGSNCIKCIERFEYCKLCNTSKCLECTFRGKLQENGTCKKRFPFFIVIGAVIIIIITAIIVYCCCCKKKEKGPNALPDNSVEAQKVKDDKSPIVIGSLNVHNNKIKESEGDNSGLNNESKNNYIHQSKFVSQSNLNN